MAVRRSPSARSGENARIGQIVEAVQDFPLTGSPYWPELSVLSDETELDGIEVDPAGVTLTDDGFEGLMNVYVGLKYGTNKGEPVITSDAFTGRFNGHFSTTGRPEIDSVAIDTAPFYED
jgi:hypothetical protein